jgi:hypothetical protein
MILAPRRFGARYGYLHDVIVGLSAFMSIQKKTL